MDPVLALSWLGAVNRLVRVPVAKCSARPILDALVGMSGTARWPVWRYAFLGVSEGNFRALVIDFYC